jgi:hypothetical protein
VILLTIVTLGFYSWYWIYKTMEEIGGHVGEGLGGVLSLVIWILIRRMAFGKCRRSGGTRGRPEPPVTGWTASGSSPGVFIPAIVWFVKIQGALNRYWEGKGATAA